LVELAVVIVIIGVLAAFGVPHFLVSVERSKAAEAFSYLSALQSSQERYQAQNGCYYNGDVTAAGCPLDISQTLPVYFSVGTCNGHDTAWDCTLTRQGATAGYGNYTVSFTENGFTGAGGTPASTIPTAISPAGTAGAGGVTAGTGT
jgi:Tfp pilus assembly protein PilE